MAHSDNKDRPQPPEPPTLPPPSLWRLIVAGVVIVGFLWFLYDYQRQLDEAEAERLAPPAESQPPR